MQSSPTEFGVSECNLETSIRMRPRPTRAVEPLKKQYLFTLTSYMFQHSCGHLQAVHFYKMLIYTTNIVLLFSFSFMFSGKPKVIFKSLKPESEVKKCGLLV
jgi:hypothetical protein